MTSAAASHAKHLTSLLKSLRGAYEQPEPPERGLVDELVYSLLLWEANTTKADAAFKRIQSAVVDYNELRVCKPAEIEGLLGKTYPRVEERAQRLKATLTDIYLREHAVSLDAAAAMSKRDGRKYIETLDGMPHYAASRVVLLRMGGHALPVDGQLLALLKTAEVVEPEDDEVKAAGILERHIKAGEGVEAHLLFQAWSDDPSAKGPPEGGRSKRSSAAGTTKRPSKKSAESAGGSTRKRSARSGASKASS